MAIETQPPDPSAEIAQSERQLRYAALLERGTKIGMVVLVVSFIAYVTSWLPPHVPVDRLPELWGLSVSEYLQQAQMPRGFSLLGHMHRGDVLGLAGIAILAGTCIVSLLALVPMYAARRDRIYAALALLDAVIVLIAASGVID